MSRQLSIDCDLCGTRLEMDRAKEVLVATDENAYHVMDLCPECLDSTLQESESVNDTQGWRQQVAAMVRLPGLRVPEPKRA